MRIDTIGLRLRISSTKFRALTCLLTPHLMSPTYLVFMLIGGGWECRIGYDSAYDCGWADSKAEG